MSREELLSQICLTNSIEDCVNETNDCHCTSTCYPKLNKLLDEYDKRVKNDAIDELEKHIDGLKSISRFDYESIKGVVKQLKEKK